MSELKRVAFPSSWMMTQGSCSRALSWVAAFCIAALISSDGAGAQRARTSDSLLTITFFDVGQGDAALIRTPNGKHILIDAGPSGANIAARLRGAGIDTIHLAVASHNHVDHVGGMIAVLNAVHVKTYLENGMPATSQSYMRLVAALERRRTPVLKATKRQIDLGEGVVIRVVAGLSPAETQNDASIGLVLSYGSFAAFFSGDAETAARLYWASEDTIPRAQLLKVSHHGSSNGTDWQFLQALKPCAAVVSVGARNGYGHPAPGVLALLDSSRVMTYRTDHLGTVTISAASNGRLTASTTTSGTRIPQPDMAACLTGVGGVGR